MNCPYCNEELVYEDYYGIVLPFQDNTVIGEIYRCENEECIAYKQNFYTSFKDDGNLYEGYPC